MTLSAPTPAGPVEGSTRLRENAIGVRGMVFAAICVAAPVTVMASNAMVSVAYGVGIGTVGLWLCVAALYFAYAIGYVRLSRQVVNAGAYYGYVSYGLGKPAGASVAMCAAFFYMVGFIFMTGTVGYFGSLFLNELGVGATWWHCTAVVLAVTWWIGYRGLSISARVNIVIGAVECIFVLVLAMAVLLQSPQGWTLDVVSPSNVFGASGLAFTFALGVLTFAGFEAAASFGEEARDARKSVGRAVFISLGMLTFFMILGTWTMIAGAGPGEVVALALQDPGVVLPTVASTYLGGPMGTILLGMITFSFFAATIAFFGFESRYIFSLAREEYLPRTLGTSHRVWQTPVAAGTLVILIDAAALTPFIFDDGSNILVSLNYSLAGPTAISLLVMMIGCCVSVVWASRKGRLEGSAWAVIVAPLIAASGFLACIVTIVSDYATFSQGGSTTLFWLLGALMVYGWLIATRKQSRRSVAPSGASAPTEVG